MEHPVFSYALVAPEGVDLAAKAGELTAKIRAHKARHDFAQRFHIDEIRVEPLSDEDEGLLALLLPFHKENFPELAVLNQYIRARAAEAGLELRSLILPDGSSVPLGMPS